MRCRALLAASLVAAVSTVAGHPICFDDTPPDVDVVLDFCLVQESGTCCTDGDVVEIQTTFAGAGVISDECADYFKQLLCAPCNPYAGHLYSRLSTLGLADGLTMKPEFCFNLVSECTGQGGITFPSDYEGGLDYCEMHAGSESDEFYWSFPFEEPPDFEPGLNEAFPGVDQPSKTLSVKQSPDGSMFWLMGQDGEIISVGADRSSNREQVLNIGPNTTATIDGGDGGYFFVQSEEGLIDFAFDPNFDGQSGAFYASYTVKLNDGNNPRNRLSKFQYFAGDAVTTRNSEEILLTTISKTTGIHASGWVDFKPSDFKNPGPVGSSHDIYWSTGDGGPQLDTSNVSQDETNMLGAIIRITVSATGTGYSVPNDNIASSGDLLTKTEICAYGFRNPFRCGFDRDTDELYCGDVGHNRIEEIDIVECGNNYGWSFFEGSRCLAEKVNGPDCPQLQSAASREPFAFPYFEYCHPGYKSDNDDENTGGYDLCGDRQITGWAVIGGYVYRGELFADLLFGAYIFADNVRKNVYYLLEEDDGTINVGTIVSDFTVEAIGFSQTITGELMIIDEQYNIYDLPCGDLCATTCLEQAEDVPTFESEGCFKDVVLDRALPEEAPSCGDGLRAMSAEICASYCATIPGMEYMGLQYAFECFCGGSGVDFDRHGSSDKCTQPCVATPDEFCGGVQAMEVFKLSASTDPGMNDTVLTTPPPAPAPSISLIGCFKDVASDRIMTLASSSSAMTNQVCAGLCADSLFFGTQYGQECWCGSSDDYDRHGTANCGIACTGDASATCGGNYAASVYSIGGVDPGGTPSPAGTPSPGGTLSPVEVPSFNSLGCFKDLRNDRIMTLELSSSAMTNEVCAGLCFDSPFFATQYSQECWCGSSNDYDRHGTANCGMACAGDADQTCGGSFAASVYSIGGVDPGGTPSPVGPVATPSPVEVPSFTSLGCFKDVGTDRIMTLESSSATMSTEVCAGLCFDSPFFATQYGIECWCGSTNDYDRHGTANCGVACAGDADQTCGGSFAASVYSIDGVDPVGTPSPVGPVTTSSPVEVPNFTPIGCFADVQTDRIMTRAISSAPMTIEVCAGLCVDSLFFGTQYGQECWCGSSDDYDRHGTANCGMACAGDADQTCGGNYAASVYSIGGA